MNYFIKSWQDKFAFQHSEILWEILHKKIGRCREAFIMESWMLFLYILLCVAVCINFAFVFYACDGMKPCNAWYDQLELSFKQSFRFKTIRIQYFSSIQIRAQRRPFGFRNKQKKLFDKIVFTFFNKNIPNSQS
jgi:hypothetical protein